MKDTINLGDGRKVTLIGTAHVSEESRKEVRETIEKEHPDLVGVELDEARLKSLRDDSGWKELNVAEAIREGKGFLLFFNLLLSVYQRRLGMKQGVKPGGEMLEAVYSAEENDIEFNLLDRDINETLSRAFSQLSFIEKIKLVGSLFIADDDIEIEDLKQKNLLDSLIEELEEELPKLKEVFLDERNDYMAEKLLEDDFSHAVVVVGAAHMEGIKSALKEERKYIINDTKSFFPWFKVVKYGIPAFIIGMLGYSFYQVGFGTGLQASKFWILSNGILSMVGAILARSHILTWLTSLIAAPITSLNPTIGAGMVAAYVEAKFYQPTVEELESIAYIESYRELWSNQVGRVLLTFVFVTIGSAIATFASAGYIASLIA